jgi:hypothetical protein
MIKETLEFIAAEVNKYLSQKLGGNTNPRLVLGNIAKAFDVTAIDENSLSNKAILSLVNIEEDNVAKNQVNYMEPHRSLVYKNPPLYLNLYIVIAVNRISYAESLEWLAYVIRFFQFQSVFTPQSHSGLDPRIQRLILDLHPLEFEQHNGLWNILGGKYIPSVLYKIRQVTLEQEAVIADGVITELPK